MDIQKLKSEAKTLDPVLRIGKNGLNDNVFEEVEKLLKKRKLIKIKILRNCPTDKNEVFDEIIKASNSVLVSKIGNTATLFRQAREKR